MSKVRCLLCAAVAAAVLGACKPAVPGRYIQPGDMEDILYDFYLARAMGMRTASGADQRSYQLAVLRKHGVTEAEFDSSLVYYYGHAERLNKIYSSLTERMSGLAESLGATSGEMGKFSTLGAAGDTANIWNGASRAMLMPLPPYNRMDFHLEADSSYRRGDRFQFNMMAQFMYQSGMKNGVVYVAVDYDNDSTATFFRTVNGSGITTLDVPANGEAGIKALRGFVYLGNGLDQTPLQKLMFIDGIQLVRFHPKEDEVKAAEEASPQEEGGNLRTDSMARPAVGPMKMMKAR